MAEREVTQSSSGMEFSLQDKIYDFVACSSNKIIPINIASLCMKQDPRLNILLLCQVGADPGHAGSLQEVCTYILLQSNQYQGKPWPQWSGQCPVFCINKYINIP